MSDNTTLPAGTGGDIIADEDVSGVKYQRVKLVDATVGQTGGTGIAAKPLQVSLANTAANSIAVKVDNSGVTQPVSGTVTTTPPSNASTNIAQVAGTATDVNSGTKSAGTQRVVLATDQPQLTNALKVDGSGVTQPVSGTFFQATQPVSGTVTANAGTGNFSVSQVGSTIPTATTMQSAVTANGNGTSLNVAGYATAVINITASVAMSGGTTINFEGSVDDTTWVSLLGNTTGANTLAVSTTTTGDWELNVAGYKSLRARISAYSAGTITVKGYSSVVTGAPNVVNSNIIGTVPVSGTVTSNAGSGTFNIQSNASVNNAQIAGTTTDTNSGTKSAGTQRVVLATDQPALTNALKVDGSAVTQPVSGTITANAGSGTLATAEVAPTTVLNGKKTVTTAGTRVTLAASTACKSVTIKALAANTGTIYVGDTSVASTNGFALLAGESATLDIANLTTVNLDSSVNGEGVTYLGVN